MVEGRHFRLVWVVDRDIDCASSMLQKSDRRLGSVRIPAKGDTERNALPRSEGATAAISAASMPRSTMGCHSAKDRAPISASIPQVAGM